jgi:histidinol-phosphate aminotransferase
VVKIQELIQGGFIMSEPVSHRGISRRGFLGTSAAVAASSFVHLTGVGRVCAQPYPRAVTNDYVGRLCYNENPLGPAPAALTAMQEACPLAHRYPDWYSSSLESQIAAFHGLSSSNVCAGAGATEVIRLIADALLGPGDELVTATPTYSQMAGEAVANGASVVHVPVDGNHVIDLDAILAAVGPATTMVSLVNPNNPVATIFAKTAMESFAESLPDDVVVVVDEAYHDYVHSSDYESCMRYFLEGKRFIVVRTLSKAYGLAGSRIGYALGSSQYISQIGSSQIFGTISRPSQAAAQAALGDATHVANTVALNDQAKALLETGFTTLNLDFIPSHTNFMMFDTGGNAAGIASELGAWGYQVRYGWGMPRHIRVSTGLLSEVQGFLEALESILVSGVGDDPLLPHTLAVNATYPNPFNATCNIELSIPGTEPVILAIYDVAGRKIRALETARLGPGVHQVTWDGRDHTGRHVASGTYVLNLIQGEYATSSRISLVK